MVSGVLGCWALGCIYNYGGWALRRWVPKVVGRTRADSGIERIGLRTIGRPAGFGRSAEQERESGEVLKVDRSVLIEVGTGAIDGAVLPQAEALGEEGEIDQIDHAVGLNVAAGVGAGG